MDAYTTLVEEEHPAFEAEPFDQLQVELRAMAPDALERMDVTMPERRDYARDVVGIFSSDARASFPSWSAVDHLPPPPERGGLARTVLVVGAPGCGKTLVAEQLLWRMLQRVATPMASPERQQQLASGRVLASAPIVPVYMHAADVARLSVSSIDAYIAKRYASNGPVRDFLLQSIEEGRFALILDELDVLDTTNMSVDLLHRLLQELCGHLSRRIAYIIVLSRPRIFELPLVRLVNESGGFAWEVLPLSRAQQKSWIGAMPLREGARDVALSFLRHPALVEMCSSPMCLAAVCQEAESHVAAAAKPRGGIASASMRSGGGGSGGGGRASSGGASSAGASPASGAAATAAAAASLGTPGTATRLRLYERVTNAILARRNDVGNRRAVLAAQQLRSCTFDDERVQELPLIRSPDVRSLLMALAGHLHMTRSVFFSDQDIKTIIAARADKQRFWGQLWHFLSLNSNMFAVVGRAYRFVSHSLQQYFAACGIVEDINTRSSKLRGFSALFTSVDDVFGAEFGGDRLYWFWQQETLFLCSTLFSDDCFEFFADFLLKSDDAVGTHTSIILALLRDRPAGASSEKVRAKLADAKRGTTLSVLLAHPCEEIRKMAVWEFQAEGRKGTAVASTLESLIGVVSDRGAVLGRRMAALSSLRQLGFVNSNVVLCLATVLKNAQESEALRLRALEVFAMLGAESDAVAFDLAQTCVAASGALRDAVCRAIVASKRFSEVVRTRSDIWFAALTSLMANVHAPGSDDEIQCAYGLLERLIQSAAASSESGDRAAGFRCVAIARGLGLMKQWNAAIVGGMLTACVQPSCTADVAAEVLAAVSAFAQRARDVRTYFGREHAEHLRHLLERMIVKEPVLRAWLLMLSPQAACELLATLLQPSVDVRIRRAAIEVALQYFGLIFYDDAPPPPADSKDSAAATSGGGGGGGAGASGDAQHQPPAGAAATRRGKLSADVESALATLRGVLLACCSEARCELPAAMLFLRAFGEPAADAENAALQSAAWSAIASGSSRGFEVLSSLPVASSTVGRTLQYLQHESEAVRAASLFALLSFAGRDMSVIAGLLDEVSACYADDSAQVRAALVRGMARWTPPSGASERQVVVEGMLFLVADTVDEVRFAAMNLLEGKYGMSWMDVLQFYGDKAAVDGAPLAVVRTWLWLCGETARVAERGFRPTAAQVAVFEGMLDSDDAAVRELAAVALANSGHFSARCAYVLCDVVEKKGTSVTRLAALRQLGKHKFVDAKALLVWAELALNEADTELGKQAALTLSDLSVHSLQDYMELAMVLAVPPGVAGPFLFRPMLNYCRRQHAQCPYWWITADVVQTLSATAAQRAAGSLEAALLLKDLKLLGSFPPPVLIEA